MCRSPPSVVPELIIGRDPSNPICVPEQAVSRQHARIRYDGQRWLLTDLGSRNGTMVDGQFIQEVELQHLHEIRVGDAIFKFVQAGAESYARYRIDSTILGASPSETAAHRAQRGRIVGGASVR